MQIFLFIIIINKLKLLPDTTQQNLFSEKEKTTKCKEEKSQLYFTTQPSLNFKSHKRKKKRWEAIK